MAVTTIFVASDSRVRGMGRSTDCGDIASFDSAPRPQAVH
jgi:hypothetical protein